MKKKIQETMERKLHEATMMSLQKKLGAAAGGSSYRRLEEQDDSNPNEAPIVLTN